MHTIIIAGFPYVNTPEAFDFGFQSHQEDDSRVDYRPVSERAENVVFLDPFGTGETRLASRRPQGVPARLSHPVSGLILYGRS